ncbi:MAG: hypothetical protein ACE5NC_06755 [Anaerolineae bacterium]
MKRILVPPDGSPLAEAILPVAEEWVREEEAKLISGLRSPLTDLVVTKSDLS